MDEVKQRNRVRVHYKGTLEDGRVFESTLDGEPLELTIGRREVIPKFESALIGMKAGEKKTIHIPPEEAYGARHEDLIMKVEKSFFPDYMTPKKGYEMNIPQEGENFMHVVIADVDEDTITIDTNHPLAGKMLSFEVELLEIL